jgi:hypothetical protein
MELPVTVHNDLTSFGSDSRPLRPSRVAKLLGCAMQIVLDLHGESAGGKAAQTGNLVHDAAEWYHKTTGQEEARVAAGLAALEKAREQFPKGDAEEAVKIFRRYAADPKNRDAEVVWCEQQVTLKIAAAAHDPTGAEIVITGTLDQVRRDPSDGALTVWDIKTGSAKTGPENVTDYSIQQAVYTLAARATLDEKIQPGGLIFTPHYGRKGGQAHLPLGMTVADCEALLTLVPAIVAQVRSGVPPFRPSAEGCKWCEYGPWPTCRKSFNGLYGV